MKDKFIPELTGGGGYDNLSKDARIVIYDKDKTYQVSLSDLFSRIYDLVKQEVNSISGGAIALRINWRSKEDLTDFI